MQREYKIDSIKFYLILIVIFGHTIESAIDNNNINYIYRFIYIFHMPAFIFLSGMFSSEILDSKKSKSLITTILLPLLFHQIIFKLIESDLRFEKYSYNIIIPSWGMWYLMSLISWRLMTPLFSSLKYPLLIAIILSLVAGSAPYINQNWSSSRTIAFFPFFLAGYMWSKKNNFNYKIPHINTISIVIGWLLVASLALFSFRFRENWLYMSSGYMAFKISNIEGAYLRAMQLAIGFFGVLCIFSTLNKFNFLLNYKFIADLGKYTMSAYILHLYFITFAKELGLKDLLLSNSTISILFIAAFSSLFMTIVFTYFGKLVPWLFNFSFLKINK